MNALDLYAGASGATRGRTLKTTLGLIRRRIGGEWVGARAMTCSFLGPKTGLSIAAYADSTLRRPPRKPPGPNHSSGGGVRHRPLASRAHRLRSPNHDWAAALRNPATTAHESQRRASEGRSQVVETRSRRRAASGRDAAKHRGDDRRTRDGSRQVEDFDRERAASPP
jgi:hypothetical protein